MLHFLPIHGISRLVPTALIRNRSKYWGIDKGFNQETINHHAREYVRGDVYTNTAEGWFALLRRGITGIFHHVSEEHLDRYVKEFEFRYNNRNVCDGKRAQRTMRGTEGKRLVYKETIKKAGD